MARTVDLMAWMSYNPYRSIGEVRSAPLFDYSDDEVESVNEENKEPTKEENLTVPGITGK